MQEDTIAAITTPLGEAGIAVIRISGSQAIEIADRCFKAAGKLPLPLASATSHTVHYGHVVNATNQLNIDEVLVTVMRSPRTYTREDVVEIGCHGGMISTKSVLDVLLASGARLAQPGEFTKRAFLNGRIDLAQAEAVADIIHARTELALAAAEHQLRGSLSSRISSLRDDLVRVLAHIEAHIDFPDEDISPDTQSELGAKIRRATLCIKNLLATANEGQILRKGVRASILGRPNVGKSSLLNKLLGHDRAIVAPTSGTTRDTIEETANVRGIPIVFVDTAGLHDSSDEIEREGIKRSRDSASRSEIILHVLDASSPLPAADLRLIEEFQNRHRLFILNKADLPPATMSGLPVECPVVKLSALTGAGIEDLKDTLKKMIWHSEISVEATEIMINSRHQEALNRSLKAAEAALGSLDQSAGLEITAMELRIAVNAVGEIVGKTSTEDVLDSIFSQFCIGK